MLISPFHQFSREKHIIFGWNYNLLHFPGNTNILKHDTLCGKPNILKHHTLCGKLNNLKHNTLCGNTKKKKKKKTYINRSFLVTGYVSNSYDLIIPIR